VDRFVLVSQTQDPFNFDAIQVVDYGGRLKLPFAPKGFSISGKRHVLRLHSAAARARLHATIYEVIKRDQVLKRRLPSGVPIAPNLVLARLVVASHGPNRNSPSLG
jgi:hypothetical protein